jgi:sensor histidine kinase YesM
MWTIVTGEQIEVGTRIIDFGTWLPYFIFDTILFNVIMSFLLLRAWIPVSTIHWGAERWLYYVVAHLSILLIFMIISSCCNGIIMWIATDGDDWYWYLRKLFFYEQRGGMSIIIYAIVMLTYYLYIFVKRVQEKQLNEIRLNQIIKSNELNLLKSQINPHFLFNSLNSLNSLIITDTEQAQKMLLALSDYLRYTVLSNNNPYATLQQEIANSERYLSTEKLRFGDRLNYRFDIPDACANAQVPSMLLQPLFENAVKHGVYESLQAVFITADAITSDGNLVVIITNDCDPEHPPKKGAGAGLKYIRERLWLTYENKAGLHTTTKDGKFIATLQLPYSSFEF